MKNTKQYVIKADYNLLKKLMENSTKHLPRQSYFEAFQFSLTIFYSSYLEPVPDQRRAHEEISPIPILCYYYTKKLKLSMNAHVWNYAFFKNDVFRENDTLRNEVRAVP